MRLFVGLAVPNSVRSAIESLIHELKPLDDSWRWVRAENLHVTLKFLGEVTADKLPELIHALRNAPSSCSVSLNFQRLGFFPNERRPRVLWLGLDEAPGLIGLAATIENVMAGAGFPREEREFAPHLTLARSKLGTISQPLRDAATKYSARQFGTMGASTFHLIESKLKSTGPSYTTLESFPLTR